jgi:hypothetical protein
MKPKAKIFSKVGAIVRGLFQSPIVRGTLKSLPFGNFVYEVVENVTHKKNPEKKADKSPHSAISLLAQLVFLSIIIYAFATKQISIEEVLRYILPDDFKTFGAENVQNVGNVINDTIAQ